MKLQRNYKILSVLTACLLVLTACGGGDVAPLYKTVKMFKLVKQEIPTGPTEDEARSITFDYNKFGNLIRQNHSDLDGNLERTFEFDYDDKGVLLTGKEFLPSATSPITLVEFDDRGEVVFKQGGRSNANDPYENTYNNDAPDVLAERRVLQQKILKTFENNAMRVSPKSKLISRERGGRYAKHFTYAFSEGGKMFIVGYYKPDDGVSDVFGTETYNAMGDIEYAEYDFDGDSGDETVTVTQQNAYNYDNDENGNLKTRIKVNKRNDVITTHYTWEEKDVLVPK